MIPEFVGRLPIVATLDSLDETALERILVEPKNAITKQYIEMFKMDGIDLTFDPKAIKAVARRAIELKTGARGLRTILEERMLDVMYSVHFEDNIKKIIYIVFPIFFLQNREVPSTKNIHDRVNSIGTSFMIPQK